MFQLLWIIQLNLVRQIVAEISPEQVLNSSTFSWIDILGLLVRDHLPSCIILFKRPYPNLGSIQPVHRYLD